MKQLTSKNLKKMSIKELEELANQYATKLLWYHSTGKNKEAPDTYKRLASELLHISNIIEDKQLNKPKNKYYAK